MTLKVNYGYFSGVGSGIAGNVKRLGFRRAKKAETEYKHKTKLNNK